MTSRVNAVVNAFHAVDPTFLNKSIMKSLHLNCLNHLEKGCLSDHPEVSLYLEIKEGSDATFKKLKAARGSSQQEGFHYYIRRGTAAKTVSPILYDLFLTDMTHRWNVDRSTEVHQMPAFKCYDLALLNSIHQLWSKNSGLFTTNPVDGFVPVVNDGRTLEMFGCSRVVHSILIENTRSALQ